VSLDSNHIHKLCELARLAIAPEEVADVSAKLSDIVALVDQLQAVDAKHVTPMAHPLDRSQPLREDLITESDEHQRFQANAPLVERGLYLVPKVIE
jgi:aspartyl-tRNA(Asn)/glutamyl-tRNA(Gln) amidotransferase subunit C